MFTLDNSTTGMITVALTAGAAPQYSIHLRNVSSVVPMETDINDRGPAVVVNLVGDDPIMLYVDEIDAPTFADAAELATYFGDAIETMNT